VGPLINNNKSINLLAKDKAAGELGGGGTIGLFEPMDAFDRDWIDPNYDVVVEYSSVPESNTDKKEVGDL